MEKLVFILVVSISFLFSCKENRNRIVDQSGSVVVKSDTKKENLSGLLTNTKWIIGEVGVNGELPDTLFFYNTNKLLYISYEKGKEECQYHFSNDTLIFTDMSLEYDYKSDSDVTVINTNKLVLSLDKLIYIENVKDLNGKKIIVDLKKKDLYFSKIK
jgi:hypothetical protein